MSKRDDEVTYVQCPICNGEGMVVKSSDGGKSYAGKICWLCRGRKVIHPTIYARWIAAGRPTEDPK